MITDREYDFDRLIMLYDLQEHLKESVRDFVVRQEGKPFSFSYYLDNLVCAVTRVSAIWKAIGDEWVTEGQMQGMIENAIKESEPAEVDVG